VPQAFYNEKDEEAGFGITVVISICLHVVLFSVVFLLSNHDSKKVFISPVFTVDLVGRMPAEKTKEAPPKIDVPPEKEAKPVSEKKPIKIESKPAPSEQVISLKKEKESSVDEAIKKIQQKVKKKEEEEAVSKLIQDLENKLLNKQIKEIRERVAHKKDVVRPVKSAEVSQKGGTVQRIGGLEEKYAQLIGDIIHDKWSYLGHIKEGELAVIAVRIDKNGRLIESHIEQSSGNAMFVQSAVRAIEKAASSFPQLPQELDKEFVEIGVCFPECKRE